MASNTTTFSRRNVLKGATASAALMAAVRTSFPSGAFAQGAGPETNKVTLGFIALTDSSPLIIAKEKKLFDKYGITDANVAKQASWGTTRDNIVLGSGSGGIDGAHILTPKPYQISLGLTTPENKPVPMYILCRLNTNGQAISVAKESDAGRRQGRRRAAQGSLRQDEGRRQGSEVRHDLPRRHPRHVDPLLAGRRRHRPRQGRLDHRRAAAADGGQHEGRQHGRLLRRRAVERAARQPGHRLLGLHHRRDLEGPSGEERSACAPTGSTRTPRRRWPC